MFDVVAPAGKKVRVWIDPPDSGDQLQVHVWDYRRRREDLPGHLADVAKLVDVACATARQWLEESSVGSEISRAGSFAARVPPVDTHVVR